MRNHVIRRGSKYHYVCRVPQDLLQHFPTTQISHSLKTSNIKDATTLAASLEFATQKLFIQLRSGMLPKDMEARLVALYLNSYTTAMKAEAKGQKFEGTEADDLGVNAIFDQHAKTKSRTDKIFDLTSELKGKSRQDTRDLKVEFAHLNVGMYEHMLANTDPSLAEHVVNQVADHLKKKRGIKMNPAERSALAMELTNADKAIYAADSARLQGDWRPLEQLDEKVSRALATPYVSFDTVLNKYKKHYLNSKPDVKPGTKDDMDVECRVLLEIIGNKSIAEVNTLDTVTHLKSILHKYPKNKQQKYGDRSIQSIIRTEKGYKPIGRKTANEYVKRLKAVIDYANKAKLLNSANVAVDELFPTNEAAEDQRQAYDDADIVRLIIAICTQLLWTYGDPKPERFWIILIALFHGFRLGNIVALTKRDIVRTDRGMWIFQLRVGKTKNTIRPVAICDSLLLLGFLEWVESLKREKLFQDTSPTFSAWYNRNEKRTNKKTGIVTIVKGFEATHVTEDEKKCLYSLRHSFAGNVFDVSSDYKITADMMGHSTEKSVTARYMKRTKAETLKEINERMNLDCIDLDMLETRAQELFFS